MILPEAFITYTRELMGDDLWQMLERGLAEEQPVSIRLNRSKCPEAQWKVAAESEPVSWCEDGFYLKERPQFTFDPLLHAGAYYVQEASSMFLDHVLRQLVSSPVRMLDLCAAPGGKSTCALAALPEGSELYCNEPNPKRAQILSENMQKWDEKNGVKWTVTNNYARDYRKAQLVFDIILADVPCSGEGMFRKDKDAVAEWSSRHVEQCRLLQREIVADIWHCLRPGGLLIYSTCTMNALENEENAAWIAAQLGADFIEIETCPEWGITGSLIDSHPVCRFIPGKTRGEGLFMAVLQKHGASREAQPVRGDKRGGRTERLKILPNNQTTAMQEAANYPAVELTHEQAISYLRREAIVLPADTPRGIVAVTYQQLPLGLVKNIGNRANNLYPKEWRIKSTHLPENKEIILQRK